MSLQVSILPVLTDNYIFALHDPQSNQTAVVDPAEAAPVLEWLDQTGHTLDFIFNTHHHADHTGGNRELKSRTGAQIYAPTYDRHRIDGIDRELRDGDQFTFGSTSVQVLYVPGHTLGHIAYWMPEESRLFCGDTLFSIGCGRLFEGTPEQMWTSLERLAGLPDSTLVYCAHEYTLANGRFAQTLEPDNDVLNSYLEKVKRLREQGQPSVPTTIGLEKAMNPFLRADHPAIRKATGLKFEPPVNVFAEIRRRKDHFRG